jgi:hypothetical protein
MAAGWKAGEVTAGDSSYDSSLASSLHVITGDMPQKLVELLQQ